MLSELSGCCSWRGFNQEFIINSNCFSSVPQMRLLPKWGGGWVSQQGAVVSLHGTHLLTDLQSTLWTKSLHTCCRTHAYNLLTRNRRQWEQGGAVSEPPGLMRGFAKRMAGWMHWQGGGGWQWCIMFAEWGKRGQRLAGDAGDWVRHWGQGSWGWSREAGHHILAWELGNLWVCV